MTDVDAARSATLKRLHASRAELRRLLEPPEPGDGAGAAGSDAGHDGAFPRSRTMRTLLSGRGMGTIVALLGSLLVSRPALALKLLRLVPLGSLGRAVLVKAVAALRSRRD